MAGTLSGHFQNCVRAIYRKASPKGGPKKVLFQKISLKTSKNDHNNIRCRTQFYERTVHSGDEIDYDDRADDEQTVVTFRTGRGGGRPRKPKMPNEMLSEESNNYENNTNRVSKSNTKNSKQLKNNTTWGSWALRTLSNNSHIIQNYLIRPAVMAGAFNDPSHLVNRGSLSVL